MNKFKKIFAFFLLAMSLMITNAAEAVSIGQTYQGGIVFFVDTGGQHGLIAAKVDQNGFPGQLTLPWYKGTYFETNARADGLYAGTGNTEVIISTQTTVGLACGEITIPAYCLGAPETIFNYAALVAANYSIQNDGVTPCTGATPEKCYGDWYLPSKYELNLMYKNIGAGAVGRNKNRGGFAHNFYWSSTEVGAGSAWSQDFDDGYQYSLDKSSPLPVRAVRVF